MALDAAGQRTRPTRKARRANSPPKGPAGLERPAVGGFDAPRARARGNQFSPDFGEGRRGRDASLQHDRLCARRRRRRRPSAGPGKSAASTARASTSALRLPPGYEGLEPPVRERLGAALTRGNVQVGADHPDAGGHGAHPHQRRRARRGHPGDAADRRADRRAGADARRHPVGARRGRDGRARGGRGRARGAGRPHARRLRRRARRPRRRAEPRGAARSPRCSPTGSTRSSG